MSNEALRDLLTSLRYNELFGGVRVNAVDGLFAIAEAIEHLARAVEAPHPVEVSIHRRNGEAEDHSGHA